MKVKSLLFLLVILPTIVFSYKKSQLSIYDNLDFQIIIENEKLYIDGMQLRIDSLFIGNRTDSAEENNWQEVDISEVKTLSSTIAEVVVIPSTSNDKMNPNYGLRYYLIKKQHLFTIVRYSVINVVVFQYTFETKLHYLRVLTTVLSTVDTMCMEYFEMCNVFVYELLMLHSDDKALYAIKERQSG